jgi:urease accessory protein
MKADTIRMRARRPFVFTDLKRGLGVEEIARFIIEQGGLAQSAA